VDYYMTQLASSQGHQYYTRIRNQVIQQLASSKHVTPGQEIALVGARAAALTQAIHDAAGSQPSFQIIDQTSSASETSPKPKLYALIAFMVALLLSGRVAFLGSGAARE
jgi:capsular polysaccharide biosynthesis protein